MWKDLIIEEIHKYRDEYSKRFNYDLHEICQDIRQKQGRDNRRVVVPTPRPAKKVSKVA
jgi:hypothetical protein